jgi:hypothetical protein
MKIHEQYMGTDKVIFVGEQWGATGSHGTGRGHVRNPQHIRKQQTLYVIMKIKGEDNQGKG